MWIHLGWKQVTVLYCCLGWGGLALAADSAELKKQLAERGVTVVASRAYLAAESDLAKDLKEVTRLRREVVNATKSYYQLKAQIAGAETQMTELHNQSIQLNVQLANVNNVVANNQLVGKINALNSQLELMKTQKSKLEEQEAAARTQASDAREAYLKHVLDMRARADAVQQQYQALPEDEQVKTLLGQYNESAGTQLKLEPSQTFQASLKKLAEAEAAILSETIPLRRDGNTFYANVTINGKAPKEFIVDSGASILCLPPAMAKELGIEPTASDPEINLTVADGRTVPGRLVVLSSVRVGKFTVTDVECAVLGSTAIAAEPLLGMSYLGNFKFELHAAESTLTMTQIDTPEANLQPRRKR